MYKRLIVLLIFLTMWYLPQAQTKADSVIINVGSASKVIFAIGDKKDLETLKQYDFQAVVNDLISKLEQKDTTELNKPAESYLKPEEPKETVTIQEEKEEDWESSWSEREWEREKSNERRYYGRRTYHSFNFDLGTNNYLSDGKFPDENNDIYTVRPWGSWYVGFNSTQRTRLARKVFLEWGIGLSWYNFKFQNERLLMGKDSIGVTFAEDQRDLSFRKSKLTASYLNISAVPMIDFGGNRRKAMFFDGDHSESFRIGVGPYAGYRIDSYTKLAYKEGGEKDHNRNHDNFYLNNLRYGLRLQVGFRDTDLFFDYDVNELFAEGKGPNLNAFSFGITF